MSKFNTVGVRPATFSPITSETTPSAVTFEGGAGYARDTKSELFLLAVTNMVGEHTFYESAGKRDERYAQLVREATAADPEWTARFLRWLRSDANMRTASLVGAAEFAAHRVENKLDGLSRQVIDAVLQRPDEPGEMLAYWTTMYGRKIPKPVKRGVADAVVRMYDERALLKYDTPSKGFRFGDVLELVHPSPRAEWQGDLFEHAIDRRKGRDSDIPASLGVLHVRDALMEWPIEKRRALFSRRADSAPTVLRDAGMTWESVAGWLQGPMTADVWEAIIPSMGYMALLRNLRNFDEAGVSDDVARTVVARLSDPEQVAKSRQLPMRFLSAYRAAPSLRWSWALEQALSQSLASVPQLDGRTLILVDTSGSMQDTFSRDGSLKRWDAAAVFGIALGARCKAADVVSFSNGYYGRPGTMVFDVRRGESLLKTVERWNSDGFFIGAGTDTEGALRAHFDGHDRVVILTDEQASYGDVGGMLPSSVPLYTWNLAGYRYGHASSGGRNRHTFGGLTDQGFRMIPLLEAAESCTWPF